MVGPIPSLADLQGNLADPRAYVGYPALQPYPPDPEPPSVIPQVAETQGAIVPSIMSAGTGALPQSSLGNRIAAGESIPEHEMIPAYQAAQPGITEHQAGQLAYQELRPKLTAPAGSAEYYQQRMAQIEFDKAHPWGAPISRMPGTLGRIGHIAATIGNIAGDILSPRRMAAIPGTQMHQELEESELQTEADKQQQLAIAQEEARARMIAAEQAKHQLVTTPEGTFSVAYDQTGQPTVSELRTPAGAAMYPAGKTMQEQAYDYYMHGGPQGTPRLDPEGKPYDPIKVIEGVTGAKLGDDRKQAMNAYKQANPGANDYQAFVATEPQKQGTQAEQLVDQYFKDNPTVPRNFENESKVAGQVSDMLQKPPQQMILVPNAQGGLDVQIARPGMTLPAEFQTFTGEASTQKGIQGQKAAQAYADAYMKRGHFTGPGDEALMEQYFELAKPDSGFRMSQPQIDMLNNARDLMGGTMARVRHFFTPSAPYFSDDQRRQIVETMGMVQEAKTAARTGTTGGAGAGTAAGGRGGVKFEKGAQFVANGRLLEFQGGDVKNWKDTGPAPAGAPPGIFIPQPIAPPVIQRPTGP